MTASPRNSRIVGNSSPMRGAGTTIASVMPVSSVIVGGIGTPGFTSVSIRPSSSPPRSFSAPISVIRSSAGEAPVVSRSSTTNVTAERGLARAFPDATTRPV